jgi:spermidine synthase
VDIADARQAVTGIADERFDLVIGDLYHAAQMQQDASDRDFPAEVARVLRPDGIYAVNVADLAPLMLSRSHAATLRTSFPELCMLVRPELLRGRRFGNVVLAAAKRPGRLPIARLAAAAARDRRPYRLVNGAALQTLLNGVETGSGTPASMPSDHLDQ